MLRAQKSPPNRACSHAFLGGGVGGGGARRGNGTSPRMFRIGGGGGGGGFCSDMTRSYGWVDT